MKGILNLTWRLAVVTIIAGLLLGGTYVLTKDPIEQQTIQANTLARQEVLSAASEFEEVETGDLSEGEYASIDEVYLGKDASGNTVGATIKMNVKGFNPNIELTVGIQSDGTVSGIKISSHEETPGLGAKATEAAFSDQYKGKPADGSISVIKNGTPADSEIVAITGATITSNGVTSAVNLAAQYYAENLADKEAA